MYIHTYVHMKRLHPGPKGPRKCARRACIEDASTPPGHWREDRSYGC